MVLILSPLQPSKALYNQQQDANPILVVASHAILVSSRTNISITIRLMRRYKEKLNTMTGTLP